MASYAQNIVTIREGVYGQDVREAIASCLSGDTAANFYNLVREYEAIIESLQPPTPGAGTLSISRIENDDYLLTISPST